MNIINILHRRSPRLSSGCGGIACIALALWANGVSAAALGNLHSPTPATMQPDLARNIAALASWQWPTRRKAERRLLATHGFILSQLAAAMRQAHSLEQRDRLLQIFIQLYLRQFTWLHHGTPFIGIAFIAQLLELRNHGKPKWISAVAVTRTLPGFPGGLALRANDLIIRLNGQGIARFDTANAFHASIQQFHPGDILRMAVIRDGQLKKVELQLAGVPSDPVAANELVQQRNLIALHLIHQYLPATMRVLSATAKGAKRAH